MAIPVPTVPCDACGGRFFLRAAAFTILRGHDYGHYCANCRELYGEEDAER